MNRTSTSTGVVGLPGPPAARAGAAPDSRRWLILGVVGLAQLMVVLDATIVNIALPSAQRALGFSTVDRQWVVTAYALAFGSLLLFGGRLGDLIGRKITFLAGALGFAAASAAGHLSPATLVHGHPAPFLTGMSLIHGYTTGFWVAAAIFSAGAVICGTLFRPGPLRASEPAPAVPAGAAVHRASEASPRAAAGSIP